MNKTTILIDGRPVGHSHPTFVIAEIGVNHNGSVDLARSMIESARQAGADSVKLQTFKAERVVRRQAPKAEYQLKTTDSQESQFEMLKRLELSETALANLVEFSREKCITVLSTPYSVEDADLLDDLGVPAFKIASGQIIEISFLRHIARKRKPIILSTGMATLAEVDRAVSAIRGQGNDFLIVLQCTTDYPSRPADANIRAMRNMGEALNVPFGYSDHTTDNVAVVAAVALGACVVEKHFTLDRTMPGPDHAASTDPEGMRHLIEDIRRTEVVLGTGVKSPSANESLNAQRMRRSIVAKTIIREGEVLDESMLAFKRPYDGIDPSLIDEIVGRRVRRTVLADEPLSWEDLQ